MPRTDVARGICSRVGRRQEGQKCVSGCQPCCGGARRGSEPAHDQKRTGGDQALRLGFHVPQRHGRQRRLFEIGRQRLRVAVASVAAGLEELKMGAWRQHERRALLVVGKR